MANPERTRLLRRQSPIGLKSTPEAFLFAAIHGLCIGAVQSYSRTMMSDLLIPGKECEFFALYEITDKGSSWLGVDLYESCGTLQTLETRAPKSQILSVRACMLCFV
jgi:MFS-type transporter involved in bile tolerance (Atg22 family)